MSIQDEIKEWLAKRPYWQQIAAKKILNKGNLNNSEIDEIIELIKKNESSKQLTDHDFQEIGSSSSEKVILNLASISDIEGIENLSPRKPIKFESGRINIIFGGNGSGKSGYTRILKKACGKKHVEDLRPNVFNKSQVEQSCRIDFNLNGNFFDGIRKVSEMPIPELNSVEIFDSKGGEFYLTKENKASYSPEILELFNDLTQLCSEIRKRLEDERDKHPKKLPDIPTDYKTTEFGKLYQNIGLDKDINILKKISWGNHDDETLKFLEERLETGDPNAKARELRSRMEQIGSIQTTLQKAINSLSPQEFARLKKLNQDAREKRKIAIEGAQVFRDDTILQGIGTDTWRAMWEAARTYSTTEAYKEVRYPNTEANSYCVLCHQMLSGSAKQRMNLFEKYVSGKISTDADDAESIFNSAMKELPEVPTTDDIKTKIQAAGLNHETWLPRLNNTWETIGKIIDKINSNESFLEDELLKECQKWIGELNSIVQELRLKVSQLDSDRNIFNRKQIESKFQELKARKWTFEQKSAIEKELQRLELVKGFEDWIKETNTQSISRQAGIISKKAITESYVNRFNEELNKLGASRIKVELMNTRTEKGTLLHALSLKGLDSKQNPIQEILSEGEKRIISLAAFLADVRGSNSVTPCIFDDPISSLDQDYEERTVDQLIELSKERQIIIFTHRLSFLSSLSSKCDVNTICIRQEEWGNGEPGDVSVAEKDPANALNKLKDERLKKAEGVFSEKGKEEYRPLAKSITSDFRILLERIIEKVLLSGIIQRHKRELTTKNKLTELLKINEEDCKLIDDLMTRYSYFEHSQPDEAPINLPRPEELREDIDTLINWIKDFKKRPKD